MNIGKTPAVAEPPAKARTIDKYLGNDYVMKSSVGYIHGLPTSGLATKKGADSVSTKAAEKPRKDGRGALIDRMGADSWHNWDARCEVLSGKEEVAPELKQLAEETGYIYLATDLDHEEEAIAWHLREVIGDNSARYSRVMFSKIIKNTIHQASEKPSELDIDHVNVQQVRRFMDRVVGYMVPPLLWKKIVRGLPVDRVQSVAMCLVVEREHKIRAFAPEEFQEIDANTITPGGDASPLEVTHQNDKPLRPVNREQALAAVSLLEKARYNILEREGKPTSSKSSAPLITFTLQQVMSARLGFGVGRTMMMAQRLYEVGCITYIRANPTNLGQDAVTMVRDYISDNFGKKYLPESVSQYAGKGNSQEAYEIIRPSDVIILTESLKDTGADAQELYQLIQHQFIACQMTPAKCNSTTLTVDTGGFRLKARGHILRFDGWTGMMPALCKGDGNHILPAMDKGDILMLIELTLTQCFTKPPIRFSGTSLVRELEERGVGRPSACASIISTIQDRDHVRAENHRFYTERMGEIITGRLEENSHEPMNYGFITRMEDGLGQVADHEAEQEGVLDNFFTGFTQQLGRAEKDPEEDGIRPNQMVLTSIDCPIYGRKMGIRTASIGAFPDCPGCALSPRERCRATINLVPESKVLNVLEGDDAKTSALHTKRRRQKCGVAMDSYLADPEHRLHACDNNPTCDGYEAEEGGLYIKGYDGPIVECEKRGSEMHLETGCFGKYMARIGDEYKNIRKTLYSGETVPPKKDPVPLPKLPCEKSDAYFVLRDDVASIFLAAGTFPRSHGIHAPLAEELHCFRDRLSEKLRYLTDAPQTNPDGNKSMVHFNRRAK